MEDSYIQKIYNLYAIVFSKKEKAKTKKPVNFKTKKGTTVRFKAKRKPKRRVRVSR